MDEEFTAEEAHELLREVLDILQHHRYLSHACLSTADHPGAILIQHPSFKKVLEVSTQGTEHIDGNRYEIALAILDSEGQRSGVTSLLATDGPDTIVTAERIVNNLEWMAFGSCRVEA